MYFDCIAELIADRIGCEAEEITAESSALVLNLGTLNQQRFAAMLEAGASLIEINTGLAYEGPGLIKKILKKLDRQ